MLFQVESGIGGELHHRGHVSITDKQARRIVRIYCGPHLATTLTLLDAGGNNGDEIFLERQVARPYVLAYRCAPVEPHPYVVGVQVRGLQKRKTMADKSLFRGPGATVYLPGQIGKEVLDPVENYVKQSLAAGKIVKDCSNGDLGGLSNLAVASPAQTALCENFRCTINQLRASGISGKPLAWLTFGR